jgi:solute carrier family 34 (sodium-dependent phosphate cotransporter)
LIKAGAGGLKPLLNEISSNGVLGHLGFGWLGAYIVMSGSPVAAVALSLFSGGVTTDLETFAMINGSRLGASLIVLVVGFVSYVTGRRNSDGLYIGVVALLTAFTLWLPVVPLGLTVLKSGWLDGVRIESPGALSNVVSYISDPVVRPLKDVLPQLLLFLSGIGVLIGAFTLFDRVLPNLEAPGPRLEAFTLALQQRYAMFALGSMITLVTLSVSLSVTILVPLALKGYIRRDRVIPYIMGANITTWIDTLLAALLLNSPTAFTIVLTEMICGTFVSMVVLIFFYNPYSSLLLAVAHRISSSRRNMAVFLACLFAAPIALLVI